MHSSSFSSQFQRHRSMSNAFLLLGSAQEMFKGVYQLQLAFPCGQWISKQCRHIEYLSLLCHTIASLRNWTWPHPALKCDFRSTVQPHRPSSVNLSQAELPVTPLHVAFYSYATTRAHCSAQMPFSISLLWLVNNSSPSKIQLDLHQDAFPTSQPPLIQNWPLCCALLAHICNPSYLGGWSWEDHGSSQQGWGWDPISVNSWAWWPALVIPATRESLK
jgi:hypothetical protein